MGAVRFYEDLTWGSLETFDYVWVIIFFSVAIWPYISAFRNETSIALATVLSILLVMFVQFTLTLFDNSYFDFYPIDLFGVIPIILVDPSVAGDTFHIHRIVTGAWLHADFIHVLGNVLVIALAGVPLEQRLGPKRWIGIYFIGLLGGNIAWIASHPDSAIPAIGASGAAFGILGAYMACWPDDKIDFPLIFLIKAWPVWLIAFVRLGVEIFQMYSVQSGTAGQSNIAHMAHVGGFFLAYALARPIARGAPSPLGVPGESIDEATRIEQQIKQQINKMGKLENDPWSEAGKDLGGHAARVLHRLREEGDHLETRRAWLEELSEQTICPVCEGEVTTIMESGRCQLRCKTSDSHIRWP